MKLKFAFPMHFLMTFAGVPITMTSIFLAFIFFGVNNRNIYRSGCGQELQFVSRDIFP